MLYEAKHFGFHRFHAAAITHCSRLYTEAINTEFTIVSDN